MSQVLSSGPNGYSKTFAAGYQDKTIEAAGSLSNLSFTVTGIAATDVVLVNVSQLGTPDFNVMVPPYVYQISGDTLTLGMSIDNGGGSDEDVRIYYEVLRP